MWSWLLALVLQCCGGGRSIADSGDSGVSYYDDAYLYRAAITLIDDGGSDMTITVPPDWDLFWEAIQADGDDIRVTDSDGVTLLDYQWASFTYATRTGVIEIDDLPGSGAEDARCVWLYFGNAAATDGAATFTASTPIDGMIHLGDPSGIVLDVISDPPGATEPSQQVAKTTTGQLLIWWRIGYLETRQAPYNGHILYEEPYAVSADVLSSGTPQGSMTDASALRFVYGTDGYTYVRMLVKAGSDATDYTIAVSVTSVIGSTTDDTVKRIVTGRALLRVNDPAEP